MTDGGPAVRGKLVRDGIVGAVRASGAVPIFRQLTADWAYVEALLDKLAEEGAELRAAPPDERLGELADVFEVVLALTSALGFTEAQVRQAADAKRATVGGFGGRIWLEETRPAPPQQGPPDRANAPEIR